MSRKPRVIVQAPSRPRTRRWLWLLALLGAVAIWGFVRWGWPHISPEPAHVPMVQQTVDARDAAPAIPGPETDVATSASVLPSRAAEPLQSDAEANFNLEVPVPALRSPVMDEAALLSTDDAQSLRAKLLAFERERGAQVVVLTVPTIGREDIADYTQRVGEAWKIGRPGVGDGLLIVVAAQDRRMRIAPARALEGAVPDLMAKRIIDEQMVPAFKRQDYTQGLNAAVDALHGLIRGESLPEPSARPWNVNWPALAVLGMVLAIAGFALWKFQTSVSSSPLKSLGWLFLALPILPFMLPFVFVWLIWEAITSPPSTGRSRSDDDDGRWRRGSSSSSSGSSSGSSYSSGGGGSFSGGGASGSW